MAGYYMYSMVGRVKQNFLHDLQFSQRDKPRINSNQIHAYVAQPRSQVLEGEERVPGNERG